MKYISFLLLCFVLFLSACQLPDEQLERRTKRVSETFYMQTEDGFCFVCIEYGYRLGLTRIPCDEVRPEKLYRYKGKDKYGAHDELYVKDRQ